MDGLIEAIQNRDGDCMAKHMAFHRFTIEFAYDTRNLALVLNTLMSVIEGTGIEGETGAKAIWDNYRPFLEGMLEDSRQKGTVYSRG